MENDKGAYGANEIVEACSDAVTAMHERRNDSLFIVKLQVITRVADEEIVARLATWQRPEPKFRRGYLALYARLAESADKGAIIRHKFE
jgi:hypothetical protein